MTMSFFRAFSGNKLDETFIDHGLTTRTENAFDDVPKDSWRFAVSSLAYLDVKRQKVEEQLGNATATTKTINRHNCVKESLVLF